ncbi:hypothetical protein [Streptomyces olivochromogenes]|uniref:hypothetical protein n=1 Tax=Streptomyces olivochromogenes TaxID=1963 RepID=UPI00369F6DB1
MTSRHSAGRALRRVGCLVVKVIAAQGMSDALISGRRSWSRHWCGAMSDPLVTEWPVVAWRRHVSYGDSHWAVFNCGMVQFLTRMMLAQFDECPLGDASLWGRPAPFVSWREQRRRLVAGLDPLTGEPDPYADMYPVFDE